MRTDTKLARLSACLVAVGLAGTPAGTWAQPTYMLTQPLPPQMPGAPPTPDVPPPAEATPPAAAAATPPATATATAAPATTDAAPDAAQPAVTPPSRVGRIGRIAGTVSFHAADAEQWTPAVVNFPVTSGNGFWTEPDGQAEIDVGASQLDLAGETELDIGTLDDTSVTATAAQGEIYLDLSRLGQGETWTVVTPRGTILLGANGRYGIVAGDTERPTMVTVVAGAATVTGTNVGMQIAAGQEGVIDGTDSFTGHLQPAAPDAFLQAMVARDAPPPDPGVALPPQIAQMPGCTQLASYGTWRTSPQYGQVWYPTVTAGWVPYRDGHWAYVAPWGWTWVDAEPWGFAPFHYGRWAQVDGAWGWIPGDYVGGVEEVPEPVYAPALVSFVAADGAALAGAAIAGLAAGAFAAGAIGWMPLGWHEPYYPWFHAGPGWVRGVNAGYVPNVGMVVNNYAGGRFYGRGFGGGGFMNRAGATMVPAGAMFGSRPIGGIGRPIPAAAFGRFSPVFGREPVRPTAFTQGLTPGAAGRFGIAGGALGAARLGAPGPAFGPRGVGFAGRGGAVPLRVAGARPGVGGAGFGGAGVGGARGPGTFGGGLAGRAPGGYAAPRGGYAGGYHGPAGGPHGYGGAPHGFGGAPRGYGGAPHAYGGGHGGFGGAPHGFGGGGHFAAPRGGGGAPHFAGGGGHGRG